MIDLGANDMRTLINFEIQRIYAGWFDVLFKTNYYGKDWDKAEKMEILMDL